MTTPVWKIHTASQSISRKRPARPQVWRGEDRINRIKQDFRKPNPLNPVNPVYLMHRADHGEVRHASEKNLRGAVAAATQPVPVGRLPSGSSSFHGLLARAANASHKGHQFHKSLRVLCVRRVSLPKVALRSLPPLPDPHAFLRIDEQLLLRLNAERVIPGIDVSYHAI